MSRKPKKNYYKLVRQGNLVRAVVPFHEIERGEQALGREVKEGKEQAFEYIPRWSDVLECWLIMPPEKEIEIGQKLALLHLELGIPEKPMS